MRRLWIFALCVLLAPFWPRHSVHALDAAAEVAQIEHTVQQLRHLKALHNIVISFPSDAAFTADLKKNFAKGSPESEIQLSQREENLLGLLKKTDDLHRIIYEGISAQVIGFYDPYTTKLYVRNHSDAALGIERHVIAHEYTHALQDQYYHLRKLLPDSTGVSYRNSDVIGARHALTEGDAVTTELLFIQRTYTAKEVQAVIKFESQPTGAPKLPTATQREFEFPYTTGVQFVQALYRAGGMAGIDAAYRRLPHSSYEIMHPTAYQHGWKPVNVSLHGVTGLTDWKRIDDDVNGAFGYQEVLWEYLPKQTASHITDAYRGDRYMFFQNGSQNAMLMKSVWTSHVNAVAARSAFLASLQKRFPKGTVTGGASPTIVSPSIAVYLHVNGTRLTVAYAPTAALARQFGTAPTT